jgi:DNA polymerase I-like protein with 3'-5' exonuclease and polymerase domains
MRLVALDFETFLITDDDKTPRPVCVSTCEGNTAELYPTPNVEGAVLQYVADRERMLVMHNAAFDMGVFWKHYPRHQHLVWQAYEEDRVIDTQILAKLMDIEAGCLAQEKGAYSLAGLASRYLKKSLDKGEDTYRTRFSEFHNLPICEYPYEAVRYAKDDAITTLELYKKLSVAANNRILAEARRQTRMHWALHLTSLRGLLADAESVNALEHGLRHDLEAGRMALIAGDIYHRTKTGELKLAKSGEPTRNMAKIKALVEEGFTSQGKPVPKTEKGNVQTDEQTLRDANQELLTHLADISANAKLLSTYVPLLQRAAESRIQTTYNPLLETGRTSSFKPNVQQWPRNDAVRACLVPHPGYLFVSCDYDTLELCCLAQIHLWRFGRSTMAQAINAGKDLHLMVAASLCNVSYSEAKALYDAEDSRLIKARQLAKVANFGLAGGMSANTFVDYAKGAGVKITPEQSHELRTTWLYTWPEMQQYFQVAAEVSGDFGDGRLEHWKSRRIASGLSYTAYCNYQFQGLAADGAKEALYATVRACFNEAGPLSGSYPYSFIHDQIIIESPIDKAAHAGDALSELMVREMAKWVPDVKIGASPVLMDRWYKGAKTVRNDRGELQVWTPKKR